MFHYLECTQRRARLIFLPFKNCFYWPAILLNTWDFRANKCTVCTIFLEQYVYEVTWPIVTGNTPSHMGCTCMNQIVTAYDVVVRGKPNTMSTRHRGGVAVIFHTTRMCLSLCSVRFILCVRVHGIHSVLHESSGTGLYLLVMRKHNIPQLTAPTELFWLIM
jgi:hypothetical protein